MNSYDKFLMHGMDDAQGRFLWGTLKHKCPTHNAVLQHMGDLQRQLAAYSKHHPMDVVQEKYLRDIRFLEVMAWRMYMFGPGHTFSLRPGTAGEYNKRRRTDPSYWRMRALAGPKKADKWLKAHMKNEWVRTILARYKY